MPETGSLGRAVCSLGRDLTREPCPLGEVGLEEEEEQAQRSRGLSAGHVARKPSRLLGAQAAGTLLSFRL